MKILRVAAAVLNQTPLDWRHNLANVQACLAEARAAGVSVLCLPELCLTGYGCEDENLDPKTWCRWPILSGGFELELQELRNAAKDNSIERRP